MQALMPHTEEPKKQSGVEFIMMSKAAEEQKIQSGAKLAIQIDRPLYLSHPSRVNANLALPTGCEPVGHVVSAIAIKQHHATSS